MTETPQETIDRLQQALTQAQAQAQTANRGVQVFTPNNLPADVQARLTPQLQQLLASFGAGTTWSGLAPGSSSQPPQPPAPPTGPPLAPGPRKVPWAFKAMLLPWSWWTVFALLMVTTAPVIVWLGVPLAGVAAGPVTLAVILFLRLRKDRKQLALLKWGEVATVVDVETVNVGTYYSGTTYSNVRLAQAHGWQVERQWYSGPGTSTKITYEVAGQRATMGLHGLPYDNGVILADPRKPERALCVSAFAYDLDRDPSGNWTGHVPGRVAFGAVAMALVLAAWTTGMTVLFSILASGVDGIVRPLHN